MSSMSAIFSEVIRSALFDTIANQSKSKNVKIDVCSASTVGADNFTGIVYRVSFRKAEEVENEHMESSSNLILKVAPQNLARRSQFSVRPAFLREIFTYDKVHFFEPFFFSFQIRLENNSIFADLTVFSRV